MVFLDTGLAPCAIGCQASKPSNVQEQNSHGQFHFARETISNYLLIMRIAPFFVMEWFY
jgi:hypothetical protein